MRNGIILKKTLGPSIGIFSRLDIARMDSGRDWDHSIAEVLADCGLGNSNRRASMRLEDICPFAESGRMSIRRDSRVIPWLPHLHAHSAYLGTRLREISESFSGSLAD